MLGRTERQEQRLKSLSKVENFLDTIEAKEEILDKEGKTKLMKKCVHKAYKRGYDMGVLKTTNEMNHNMKVVDLEKEITRVSKNEYFDFTDWKSIARLFFELGLAQKGE